MPFLSSSPAPLSGGDIWYIYICNINIEKQRSSYWFCWTQEFESKRVSRVSNFIMIPMLNYVQHLYATWRVVRKKLPHSMWERVPNWRQFTLKVFFFISFGFCFSCRLQFYFRSQVSEIINNLPFCSSKKKMNDFYWFQVRSKFRLANECLGRENVEDFCLDFCIA